MIRGLEFVIPNESGCFLSDMLKPVNYEASRWICESEESYLVKEKDMIALFSEPMLSGATFRDLVNKTPQFLIFAEIKAYPLTGDMAGFDTYEEFLESACELVLLVHDSIYVEMYCKDQGLTKRLYERALQQGYRDVAYKTDENDGRTRLHV